ncbi:conserved hypothetical protein [Ricinus communis]|uniref:EF-hand domain-containing protein n=1 Tax=Ricinus communis TaxID=3988 RepID=B9R7D6_RICCO|nr:conserved hypothetical protein [Ricinus communis]
MDLLPHRGVSKHCPRTPITQNPKGFGVPYTKEQLVAMFRSFDTNKDGRLCKKELKNIFNKLGSHFSWWRVFRALHFADINGDGYISEKEFSDLVWYILSKCDYKIK